MYLQANVVAKYCSIAGIDQKSLKFAATPFLDETKDEKGMYETDAPAASRQSEPVQYQDTGTLTSKTRSFPPRLPKASVNK